MRKTKDYSFRVKSLDDGAQGSFVGYGSTYNNVDLGGDVVAPGAFTKTLQSNNFKFPLLWQHDQREPIGTVTATDSEYGLKVAGQLLMDLQEAQKAYTLLKADVIRGMSIGYDTIRATDTPSGGRLLQELKLWEISICTFPMNEEAQVVSVKSLSDVEHVLATITDASDAEVVRQLKSIDAQLKRLLHKDANCQCPCEACVAGDCEDCNNAVCSDLNCEGHTDNEREAAEQLSALMQLAVQLRAMVAA